MRKTLGISLIGTLFIFALAALAQRFVRGDDSDWWSTGAYPAPSTAGQPLMAFEILGIQVGDKQFEQAASKLGKATEVSRGDASTGREQVCYKSSNVSEPVYLIFEDSELDHSYYLFTGGPAWNGSERCVATNAVSLRLATQNGLRLGQLKTEVLAILGKRGRDMGEELFYSYLVREKLKPPELNKLRKEHPDLTEQQFVTEYGSYDLTVSIILRFRDGKLNYLAVSKSDVN